MSWTKRQLIRKAYSKIAVGSNDADITPEEYEDGLLDLDSMIASWTSKGWQLPYPTPASPGESDLDDDSNLPDYAIKAVYLSLAIELAPEHGKEASGTLRMSRNEAMETLAIGLANETREMDLLPTLPLGAGNDTTWGGSPGVFVGEPSDELVIGGQVIGSDE